MQSIKKFNIYKDLNNIGKYRLVIYDMIDDIARYKDDYELTDENIKELAKGLTYFNLMEQDDADTV